MYRKLYPLTLSLTLLTTGLSTSLHAQANPTQYENQIIYKLDIKIEGAANSIEYHKKNIFAKIKTKQNHPFSQSDFDKDLKILAKDYDRIEPSLTSIDGKMVVSLIVWPKPSIHQICWRGNQLINDASLSKELAVAPGSVFDQQTFNKAFHKLKAYYIKNGFFEVELNYDVKYNEVNNEVDITVNINEGRAGRIKEVIFKGFTRQEEEIISSMMVTKSYNFFLSFISEEGNYNEEAIQQDQYVILNYLQNEGYADAEVEIKVCDANQANRISIIIEANKGPCYTIGDITIEGNTLFKREQIAEQIRIKTGKPYCPDRVRATMQNISDLYGRKGYIDAFVNFEPRLNSDTKTYSIHFTIDEGLQYRVGLIKIIGNCSTQSKVILHETLLAPGEIFNKDKLVLTERRLANIGYFKNVNVYAVRSENGPSCLGETYRDVHIEVEETTTGNFSAFAGYSSSESVFGGFNITEKNFNISGLPWLFSKGGQALRGGGEYAHFTATYGEKTNKYVLSWTKPYFLDTPWSIGFDLERSTNKYLSSDYEIVSSGLNLYGVFDLNAFVDIGIHYRVTYANTDANKKLENTSDFKDQIGTKGGTISAVGWSFIYNSSDSLLRPTKGLRSRFDIEFAGVGGHYRFFSFSYLNTLYVPFDTRGVFKFRADARFIQPIFDTQYADIPLDERFFMGGDNEIRGFRPYRLGPKFEHSDDPMGGISLQLLSAEYQLRVLPIVDAFTFFDAGYISARTWDVGTFYKSAGFGVRLQIMGNGPPVTLGMGYPIGEQDSTNVKRFFFNIGGRF